MRPWDKVIRLWKAFWYVLRHTVVPFAIFLAALLSIGAMSRYAYYRYMPASWFLHLSQPAHVSNIAVGKPATLTFCRSTRYPNIEASGVRSFYKIVQGRELTDFDYRFKATLEPNHDCQYPTILPDNLPKTAGTYKMHTDLTFFVSGQQKVYSYNLDEPFTISDTANSLQQQIQDLQQQIKQLQSQLDVQATSSIQSLQPAPATTVSPAQTTVATSPITVTTRPTSPPSSSPPNPPQDATGADTQPSSPGLVQTTLGTINAAVRGVEDLLSVVK